MPGIVSLLDDQHTELVEKLWIEMAQQFGVGDPAMPFVPHFSYHVAEGYEIERLGAVLDEVTGETAVFTTQATGIAIFPGLEPVIYIPIARNLALTKLHERAWTAVTPHSRGSNKHYAPANWIPHITLAHGDITPENLGPILTWLHRQSISWTIPVDNLMVLEEVNGRHPTINRFTFGK